MKARKIKKIHTRFNKIINIYGDIGFNSEDITLELLIVPDKGYTFFQNILKDTNEGIKEEIQGAANFFLVKYGLDLGKFKNVDGIWHLGEHRFYPYIRTGEFLAAQFGGNCCSTETFNSYEGGFILTVGAPGFVAKGEYGTEVGENIPAGSIIFYGYYAFIDEYDTRTLYHFRSHVPSRSDVNVPLTWNLDIYDYEDQRWGKAVGSCVLDRTNLTVSRTEQVQVNTSGYAVNNYQVNVPTGRRDVRTTVSYNEPIPIPTNPFPLIATPSSVMANIPISDFRSSATLTTPVNVPVYSPIIKKDLVNVRSNDNIKLLVLNRNVITFS